MIRRSEKLEFEGARGDRLVGRLDLPPDGAPDAYVLFAHCFTCSKDLKAAVNLSRALVGERLGVFRFDFTGLGESEGDFADTSFSSNVEDLVAAARFLAAEREAPRILVGHSLGGAAVLHAARELDGARAVATLGAPADPSHVRRLLTGAEDEIRERGEAEVELAGRRFTIRREFLEDLEEARMEETVGGLGRPLLLFHSPRDRIVGIENAARLYGMARHPKSFVSLDEADHLLTDEEDSRWAASVLAAWARRYVAARRADGGVRKEGKDGGQPAGGEQPAGGGRPADAEGGVVARTGASGFRTELLAGGHALVADEPVEAGGSGTGPSPYDLLVAALGACTSMTLRMYADRKEWPLEEAVVRLRHRKVHAEDDRECESEDSRVDEVERVLELAGPLDREQRERLAEIAARCPVHRTLEAGVRVETSLAPEGTEASGDGPGGPDRGGAGGGGGPIRPIEPRGGGG